MQICPVGAELLFHANGRRDRDMTNLIVAFGNFRTRLKRMRLVGPLLMCLLMGQRLQFTNK
jgi:hypothetical protein